MCLVLSIILTFVSSEESAALLSAEANDKLLNLSSSYANEIGIEISKVENTVNVLHNTIYSTFDIKNFNESPKEYLLDYVAFLDPIILENAEKSDGIQGVYFTPNIDLIDEWHEIWYADVEGNGIYQAFDMDVEDIREVNIDNPDYTYYFEPISKMEPVWVDPYFDGLLDVYMISYVVPITKDGVLVGIIGADMSIGDIAQKIKDLRIYNTGFGMLINDTQQVVIHPELELAEELREMLDGAYRNIELSVNGEESSVTRLKYDDTDDIFTYSKLPNNWIMAIQVPTEEVLEKAHWLSNKLIVITGLGLIFSTILATILAKILERIIRKKSDAVTNAQMKLSETEKIASLVYLVSGVAHEINTPVGNSITLATYVENEAKDLLVDLDEGKLKKRKTYFRA